MLIFNESYHKCIALHQDFAPLAHHSERLHHEHIYFIVTGLVIVCRTIPKPFQASLCVGDVVPRTLTSLHATVKAAIPAMPHHQKLDCKFF